MAVSQNAISAPIASIELELPPGGATPVGATTQFAGDPTVLYVTTSEWSNWNRDWLRWHAPDFAAVMLLAVLVVGIRTVWRARRRGKVNGRVYCTRCCHELVAPQIEFAGNGKARWSGSDARCPECGTRQAPEVAGAAERRIKWTLRACAIVGAGAVVGLVATLETRDAARQSWRQLAAWPMDRLAIVWAEWPLYRALSIEELRRTAVWRIPLDGTKPSRLLEGGTSFVEPFVSDNGRVVALPDKHSNAIRYLDQRTGRLHNVEIPSPRRMSVMIAGFGPDGVSVLVAAVGVEPTRIEFWRVETDSERVERVGLIDVPNGELPIMQFIPPVAVEDESGVRWGFAGATNKSDDLYRVFAFVGGPTGWEKYELDYSTPLTVGRIAPDLSGVRLDWWPAENGVNTSKKFWSFESGDVVPRVMEVPLPTSRLKLDLGPSSRPLGTSDAIVIDAESDRSLATLGLSAGLRPDWSTPPDGRIVAGVVSRFTPNWPQRLVTNWPEDQSAQLRVWKIPEH